MNLKRAGPTTTIPLTLRTEDRTQPGCTFKEGTSKLSISKVVNFHRSICYMSAQVIINTVADSNPRRRAEFALSTMIKIIGSVDSLGTTLAVLSCHLSFHSNTMIYWMLCSLKYVRVWLRMQIIRACIHWDAQIRYILFTLYHRHSHSPCPCN